MLLIGCMWCVQTLQIQKHKYKLPVKCSAIKTWVQNAIHLMSAEELDAKVEARRERERQAREAALEQSARVWSSELLPSFHARWARLLLHFAPRRSHHSLLFASLYYHYCELVFTAGLPPARATRHNVFGFLSRRACRHDIDIRWMMGWVAMLQSTCTTKCCSPLSL